MTASQHLRFECERVEDLGATRVRDPFACSGSSAGDLLGREYRVRRWASAAQASPAACDELITTWSALTGPGAWIEIRARVGFGDAEAPSWSDWAVAARWSAGVDYAAGDWHSHTVADQAPAGFAAEADTLSLKPRTGWGTPALVEVEALLFAPGDGAGDGGDGGGDGGVADGSVTSSAGWPELEHITVLVRGAEPSDDAGEKTAGDEPASASVSSASPAPASAGSGESTAAGERASAADIDITLPAFSQRLHGEIDGLGSGSVWCSPTSLAMVLGFLAGEPSDPFGPKEPAPVIESTMRRVWDYSYAGSGNWAFNVAWANALGYDAGLEIFDGLDDARPVLEGGQPLIASVRFSKGDLPEAGYETGGHLLVVTGLTESGDVRVHDPAAYSNDDVRRVYPRAAFEKAWRQGSGGVAYVVRPKG